MDIDFDGARVETLALDYSLRVQCEPAGGFTIEVPLTLERDGATRELPVGMANLTGEFALDDLIGRRIVGGHATDDGVLTLEFEGDIRITVAVNPNYESWSLWCRAVRSTTPGLTSAPSIRPAPVDHLERAASAAIWRLKAFGVALIEAAVESR